jgi:hypothetical protein
MKTKDNYQNEITKSIMRLDARIYKLKIRSQTLNWEDEIEYCREIEELRVKEDLLKAKLRELRKSEEDSWRDIKASLEKEIDQLKKAVDGAASRLK